MRISIYSSTMVRGDFSDELVSQHFSSNTVDAMFTHHWSPEYIVNSSAVRLGRVVGSQDMRSFGARKENEKHADMLDVLTKVSSAAKSCFLIVLRQKIRISTMR